MARYIAVLVVLAAAVFGANARSVPHPQDRVLVGTPAPKDMPTPCVMKSFNSFCYLETDKAACTFYSSPSYPTYKACATSTNMGKTLKCSEVPAKDKNVPSYKRCLDKEPAGGAVLPAAAQPQWTSTNGEDIAGKDIACNGKSFCEVCKTILAVKEECQKTKGCVAFTWGPGNANKSLLCGYLKAASGPRTKKAGWSVYAVATAVSG